MDTKEFNEVLERRITTLRSTLQSKGEEYTVANDRLQNFKDAAAFLHISPEQALWGFVTKHIVALNDFLSCPGTMTRKEFEDKAGDIIAYMVLLDGLITERGL